MLSFPGLTDRPLDILGKFIEELLEASSNVGSMLCSVRE